MKKILIADDETRIRRLVADFLRQQGFVPWRRETAGKPWI